MQTNTQHRSQESRSPILQARAFMQAVHVEVDVLPVLALILPEGPLILEASPIHDPPRRLVPRVHESLNPIKTHLTETISQSSLNGLRHETPPQVLPPQEIRARRARWDSNPANVEISPVALPLFSAGE